MDRNVARQAVVAYRRAMQEARSERARAEDEAILRGYRAIARGQTIISLHDAIRAGGEFSNFLPKIAIARADEPRITVHRYGDGSLIFGRNITRTWRTRRNMGRGLRELPVGTLPRHGSIPASSPLVSNAIVPIIPPELRPNAGLERYWILFEAEWSPIAPHDPALLRDLGGGLYAVLATWELTDLEKTVLGMTRAPA
jgi:hypothetical protein